MNVRELTKTLSQRADQVLQKREIKPSMIISSPYIIKLRSAVKSNNEIRMKKNSKSRKKKKRCKYGFYISNEFPRQQSQAEERQTY